MFYTGVGSRATPPDVLARMTQCAEKHCQEGLILRSGHANGADMAFEIGAKEKKEIWLPRLKFNGSTSELLPTPEAFAMAAIYVGHWRNCDMWARQAHARNCHQVLGKDLKTPSKFLVCWTPGGKVVGGTATAMKIAADWSIEINNMWMAE